MNIIIPLGGKGERFTKKGFHEPKAMIPIMEKRMIEYVLDSVHRQLEKDDLVSIFYNHRLEEHGFTEMIRKKYPYIHLIPIQDTRGAVESVYQGITQLYGTSMNKKIPSKCLLLDCDTYYTQDVVTMFRRRTTNTVFYTHNTSENAVYSYIRMEEGGKIIEIKEKEKISNHANTGAYAFMDIHELYRYCKYVLDNHIFFKNEPYTSCVIWEMIKEGIEFKGKELETSHVFSLGIPEDVEYFLQHRYAFLFDLDGTLVITEDVYYEVWQKILSQWNIHLTPEIFGGYIQGNNDKYVLNTLLWNVPITLDELSAKKDELFIEHLDKIKMVKGVQEWLSMLYKKAYKICIVTNCNQCVAQQILEKTGLKQWIDFMITSNDCQKGKPDPDPYLRAIEIYKCIPKERCIIFEDSKTGILSGKSVRPKCLVGIETIYSTAEIQKYGVDISIGDFTNIKLEELFSIHKTMTEDLKSRIKTQLSLPLVVDVEMDEIKLKGGFIADVIGFKVTQEKDEKEEDKKSLVLKYENKEVNQLSRMAKRLELYEREYYFYEYVSKYVPVHIPYYYGLLKNNEFENEGMMMENLITKQCVLNLDLNRENINVSLKIVDRMVQLHIKFWNQPLKKRFPGLYKTDDELFRPFFEEFIQEKSKCFYEKWGNILNSRQMEIFDKTVKQFGEIQSRLASGNHLTLIHGDIKSPNIFYEIKNENEPYFIDWQHCGIGKGVQDLVFFLIESFEITGLKYYYPLLKNYYYKKVIEHGIEYSYDEYEKDVKDAISYVPFFTALWFGTTPQDELIDKNWPYFFICKLFTLMEMSDIKG